MIGKILCNKDCILDTSTGLIYYKNQQSEVVIYSLHGGEESGEYVTVENGEVFWESIMKEVTGNYSKQEKFDD